MKLRYFMYIELKYTEYFLHVKVIVIYDLYVIYNHCNHHKLRFLTILHYKHMKHCKQELKRKTIPAFNKFIFLVFFNSKHGSLQQDD